MSDKMFLPSYRVTPRERPASPTWPGAILVFPRRALQKVRRWPARQKLASLLTFCILVLLWLGATGNLSTLRRDFGYAVRPLWDKPERPFHIITHYTRPAASSRPKHAADHDRDQAWCQLHGWDARRDRAVIVDAIPISTELDMLEIRMREYAPYVSTFIIAESAMTFSGAPKPLHFAKARERFDHIAKQATVPGGAQIQYVEVTGFEAGLPVGSFQNEVKQRLGISRALNDLRRSGDIPVGAVILQTDVDEIISREALQLISTCQVPDNLHLQVRNYRYSFNQPLRDEGYWRPHLQIVPPDSNVSVMYHHGRAGDVMLADAGWHCTFCFPTLEDMRAKMTGYSHNDRLRDPSLLLEAGLRRRVCNGEDPFNMWPEAFTFKDLIALSGRSRPENSFVNVPVALKEDPTLFPYLLDKGCERPNQ